MPAKRSIRRPTISVRRRYLKPLRQSTTGSIAYANVRRELRSDSSSLARFHTCSSPWYAWKQRAHMGAFGPNCGTSSNARFHTSIFWLGLDRSSEKSPTVYSFPPHSGHNGRVAHADAVSTDRPPQLKRMNDRRFITRMSCRRGSVSKFVDVRAHRDGSCYN